METQSLMNIDSTNMQPEYWVEIAEAVKANYDAYDGFVITHGTDTMAYTSAALSYMLQHAKSQSSSRARRFRSRSKNRCQKNITDAIRFACEGVGAFTLYLTAESFKERVRSN